MGGCQNYGPFWGPYYNTAPIFRVLKIDPNFDNYPNVVLFCFARALGVNARWFLLLFRVGLEFKVSYKKWYRNVRACL